MRVLGKQTQIYIRTYSRTLFKQEESLTNIKSLFYKVIIYFLPLYVVAFLNQYLSLLFYLSFTFSGSLSHSLSLAFQVHSPRIGVLVERALGTGSGLQHREGVQH